MLEFEIIHRVLTNNNVVTSVIFWHENYEFKFAIYNTYNNEINPLIRTPTPSENDFIRNIIINLGYKIIDRKYITLC